MTIRTMTSLTAQNQFGALLDASQQASTQTIPFLIATLISENYPLRGKNAGDVMRLHLAKMSNRAFDEGLTQGDVTRMLNEDQARDEC